MNKELKLMIWEAMIATIYVALVYAFQFISFGQVQFRIAEALLVLVFFNPKHMIGITIGTFIANFLLSTLGILDPIVGTLATVIALSLMVAFKQKPLLALIFPVIVNAFIVAAMLNYLLDLPYLMTVGWVALGEATVVYAVGYPLYRLLQHNTHFKELMEN